MNPSVIIACAAMIAVGVGIIMFTVLRTPTTPAGIGDRPSISLGEEPEIEGDNDAETTEEETAEEEATDEAEEIKTEEA